MIDRSPPVTLTLDCGLLPPPREDALPDFRNQRTFFLFPRPYRARERPNFELVLEGHEGIPVEEGRARRSLARELDIGYAPSKESGSTGREALTCRGKGFITFSQRWRDFRRGTGPAACEEIRIEGESPEFLAWWVFVGDLPGCVRFLDG